ncbi:uncharacterized protein LOC120685695 [Panicum virgatum]|uniref:Uncharacterized protein n=1 Tax=Panicum virgatum TaxID=38727 RepID=A0A8T0P2P9_PANVG|nr:uncharacterized protein LOC120685695 [Panicum virgatum]XP_039823680.1 uncharacterized protein LOC120685695 [Panicum virgatum]XP_039823682.1 uncharacterized protein LOC120685695 [Panicum virgatum]XP_039823683.1 uncharacterized protein LOC120685695 [Panicum virgatum]XP_039823684.1 uncharacterized protein LOC120685695 [Panicum virgatum]XP_039823685.1 uncharacterized protein LOC120685695 [Panicum virgatum]XP_039823686.1 uncharacterized protein LOC120685695 [Panicum virgatum]XP_039823687.1 unc
MICCILCLEFVPVITKIAKLENSCDALLDENEKLNMNMSSDKCMISRLGSVNAPISYKSSDALPCDSCDSLLAKNDDLNASLACLKSENDMLKSNASMPCNSCVALHSDLDKARDEVVLLKSNASLPCALCESLKAEIKELKLTHTTCVEQLEHSRAEIIEIKSLPSAMCSLKENGDACLASIDNHDALHGISKIDASPIICTTCIDLKSKVEALKRILDDMSIKLVEHNDMSARFEIEVDLLRTTYAKCIEEQVESFRNAPCGTCDRLKSENEFLSKRYKSLCAKSFDSRDSCNSDDGVSKLASSQPELASVERESLDFSTSACASDSSFIAIPKPVASSGVAQSDSDGKGASHFFGAHISKPKFHCTFCKKDGHSVEFCFRRVKHERRVRVKASRMSCSLPHGTCDSKLGTKYRVDASGSKSQGTSHFRENGDSSSRTVSRCRPLYHCPFCEKDGHQVNFCYRRARRMWRVRASRPLVVHSPSDGMSTRVPSKKPRFIDGFFDSFSSGFCRVRGHASNASRIGP